MMDDQPKRSEAMNEAMQERVASLRADLDQVTSELAEIESTRERVLAVAKAFQKAIAALEEGMGQKPKRHRPKSSKDEWVASEKMVNRVRAAVQEHFSPEEDLSVNSIASAAGVSTESARKAVDALRKDGDLRMVSPAGPGKSAVIRRMI